MQDACSTLDEIAGQVAKWEQDLAIIEQMKQAAKNPRCAYCGAPPGQKRPLLYHLRPARRPPRPGPHPPQCPRPGMHPLPAPRPRPRRVENLSFLRGAPGGDAVFCTSCGQPVAAPAGSRHAEQHLRRHPQAPQWHPAPEAAPEPELAVRCAGTAPRATRARSAPPAEAAPEPAPAEAAPKQPRRHPGLSQLRPACTATRRPFLHQCGAKMR